MKKLGIGILYLLTLILLIIVGFIVEQKGYDAKRETLYQEAMIYFADKLNEPKKVVQNDQYLVLKEFIENSPESQTFLQINTGIVLNPDSYTKIIVASEYYLSGLEQILTTGEWGVTQESSSIETILGDIIEPSQPTVRMLVKLGQYACNNNDEPNCLRLYSIASLFAKRIIDREGSFTNTLIGFIISSMTLSSLEKVQSPSLALKTMLHENLSFWKQDIKTIQKNMYRWEYSKMSLAGIYENRLFSEYVNNAELNFDKEIFESGIQTLQYETNQNFLIANYLSFKYGHEKSNEYINRATLGSRRAGHTTVLLSTSAAIKLIKMYIIKTPDPTVISRMLTGIMMAALLPTMDIKQKIQEHIDLYLKYTQ